MGLELWGMYLIDIITHTNEAPSKPKIESPKKIPIAPICSDQNLVTRETLRRIASEENFLKTQLPWIL
jgi:hypothetical protein